MAFFDKKEEVINIELTPYGKHLLSKGKWKPAYYEFYDDDIIYDFEYAGEAERQEETQQRISETPRPKVQYSFEGADQRYNKFIKQMQEIKSNVASIAQESLEVRNKLSISALPLANSSLATAKVPAWAVRMLRGEINDISSSVDVVGLPNNLYTLNLKTTNYTLSVKEREEEVPAQLEDNSLVGGLSDLNLIHKTFEDNTYVEITEDFILIEIKEENVELLNENFDMMLFEVEIDPKTQQEIEKPLYFKKPKQNIVNNILLDDVEEEIETYSGPDYVSHYFNVYIDKEINTDTLGRYLDEKEKKILTATDGYVFRQTAATDKLIVPTPQIPTITGEQIDDFEGCE